MDNLKDDLQRAIGFLGEFSRLGRQASLGENFVISEEMAPVCVNIIFVAYSVGCIY